MDAMTHMRFSNRIENAGLNFDERKKFMEALEKLQNFDVLRLLQLFESSPITLVGDFWETVSEKYDAFGGKNPDYVQLAEKQVRQLTFVFKEAQS